MHYKFTTAQDMTAVWLRVNRIEDAMKQVCRWPCLSRSRTAWICDTCQCSNATCARTNYERANCYGVANRVFFSFYSTSTLRLWLRHLDLRSQERTIPSLHGSKSDDFDVLTYGVKFTWLGILHFNSYLDFEFVYRNNYILLGSSKLYNFATWYKFNEI